jgi:hypothetical protein
MAVAATATPPVSASGVSPFLGCTADGPYLPGSVNYPNTEVEPWLEVNPANRRNLIGGWQQDRWSDGGAKSNVAGVSFDGGATWRQVVIPKITLCSGGTQATRTDFQRASDPWVTISPNGDAYFMSLVTDVINPPNRPGGQGRKSGMVVNKSEDGGMTWSDPVILVREDNPRVLHDKNTITADPNDSDYVYAVWDRLIVPTGATINPENVFGLGYRGPALLARTTNAGRTWEGPKVIYEPGANNQTIGNQIVVLPASRGGVLVDVFNEILNFKNNDRDAQFDMNVTVLLSTNKGASWTRPIRVEDLLSRAATVDTVGVRDPDTGFPVRTGDIIPEPAVDHRDGTVYIVWQDARFSGFQHDDVALSLSTDGGRTWTRAVQVNRTPERPGLYGAAFTPAIRVMDDGTVGILYYDFRNHLAPGPQLETDAWLVRYRRSGQSLVFVDETRVTPVSFDMRQAPVARGFFVGDYIGLGVGDIERPEGIRRVFKPFFTISTAADKAQVVSNSVIP